METCSVISNISNVTELFAFEFDFLNDDFKPLFNELFIVSVSSDTFCSFNFDFNLLKPSSSVCKTNKGTLELKKIKNFLNLLNFFNFQNNTIPFIIFRSFNIL